jgi:uncharacterized repeat protein (TIGR02543 family)
MVEVLNAQGNVIPGFEREKFVIWDGTTSNTRDTQVDTTDMPLAWNGVSARQLAGQDIRLRFYFGGSTVYAVTSDASPATNNHTVNYYANGATSGTAPASQTKTQDMALTLANNSGKLARTGYAFAGWNTAADGSGTNYAAGATYAGNANLSLFAKWTEVLVSPLTVHADGTLRLNNRSFKGIGVNYYSAFGRVLENINDTSYDAGFADLGSLGIPFARLDVSGYWPKHANMFFTDREEFFRRLDGVVASAERHGVGLIPSFFWTTFTFSDLAGEHLDQLAVDNSLTRQKMREFTTEIVNRYKNSRAIWAWEFGNEWSLAVDLPNAAELLPPTHTSLGNPATRDPVRDVLSTDMILPAMLEFANLVSELDPGRPISTGHATPRPSQWHQDQWKRGLLSIDSAWQTDSEEQAAEIMLRHCPDPFNLMSVHIYGNDTQRLPHLASVAASAAKALFVGEFGSSTAEDMNFMPMLSAVRAHSSLAAVWVFDRPQPVDEYNITTTNDRSWMLTALLPPPSSQVEVTETFDTSARTAANGWTSSGNTSNSNNFGWNSTDTVLGLGSGGAAGGIFARTASFSHFADTAIASLNRSDTMRLAGSFRLANANYDGNFYLGYFTPGGGLNNFIGIQISEPLGSATGSFRGFIRVEGTGGAGSSIISLPQNTTLSFDLTWAGSPDGSGMLSGTLAGQSVSVTVAAGTGSFSAFGLLSGGMSNSTQITASCYFDSLTYNKNGSLPTSDTYTVTYNANGATSGTAPASQTKTRDVALTLETNSGNLVRTGFAFAGWNTAADGTGTDYAAGVAYAGNADLTLFAKWTSEPSGTLYWDNNGGTANDWGSTANWSTAGGGGNTPAVIPGEAELVAFSATPIAGSAQTVNLNGNRTLLGLAVTPDVTANTTLQGGGTNRTLTIGSSGIRNAGSANLSIGTGTTTSGQQVAVTFAGSQAIASNGGGSITISNNVSGTGTPTITNNGTGTGIVNLGALQSTVGKVVQDSASSKLLLRAISTGFAGTVDILQGTVMIGTHPNNLGTSSGQLNLGSSAVGATAPAELEINDNRNITYVAKPIVLGTSSGTLKIVLRDEGGASYSQTITGGVTGANHLTLESRASGTDADSKNDKLTFTTGALNNAGTITHIGDSEGDLTINAVIGSNVTDVIQDSATSRLVLGSINTYNGDTIVKAGTLAVNGNAIPDTGKLVIHEGGQLNLSETTEIVGTLFFGTEQQVAGTWGATGSGATNINDTYFTGTGVVSVTVGSGSSTDGSPFEQWAGAPDMEFGGDANGDGISNGMAYLLGAAGPEGDAHHLLPAPARTDDGLTLSFKMLGAGNRGNASMNVEYSSDLVNWTTVPVPDTASTSPDGVAFDVSGSGMHDVKVTIPSVKAVGGRLYARLKASE